MSYETFVGGKLRTIIASGLQDVPQMPGYLFGHQSALTSWALKRGRCAIFADTGLGKTRMELVFSDAVSKHTNKPVLILAPLAVAMQTALEGAAIGIHVTVCRDGADVRPGVNVTNYDRLHRFDPTVFGGIVPDESSIIKHHDAKTFSTLTEAFRDTPFKLPCTATPAPNDWTELGTHAEFLGVCTRQEMLAEFFTHDGGDTSVWRLKGHARQAFWRWVCGWGALIRRPSDLGFDDSAYNLPPLHLHEHTVETEQATNGMLFAMEAQTLMERREARRSSMEQRVGECVSIIFGEWDINGLETRARGSAETARGSRSGVKGETPVVGEGKSGAEQGLSQGLHAGVLRGQPGEVQAHDTGAKGTAERSEARSLCTGQGVEGGAQSVCEGVAGVEPGEAPRTAAPQIPDHAGELRGDVVGAGRRLCDLQEGPARVQDVPDGRSLSLDGEGSRDSLLPMQHGDRQVQGRPGTVARRDGVSLEPWVIWCDLNVEQDALERAFGNLAYSIRGSDSFDEKEERITRWLAGDRPVIISKPSILGFGLNMQRAARMAFVGVTDSYEAYYQAVRRCWRFGQKRPVHVHIFASKAEGAVVANLKRKEREAQAMAESLSAETHDAVMAEVRGTVNQTNPYQPAQKVSVPSFLSAA